jgi:hypothetical protein
MREAEYLKDSYGEGYSTDLISLQAHKKERVFAYTQDDK